jgi:hypothetical protein
VSWFSLEIRLFSSINRIFSPPQCSIANWDYTTKFRIANSFLLVWLVLILLYLAISAAYSTWRASHILDFTGVSALFVYIKPSSHLRSLVMSWF